MRDLVRVLVMGFRERFRERFRDGVLREEFRREGLGGGWGRVFLGKV